MCEDKNSNKLGQVRFGLDENDMYINVNLNPIFIGRGIGGKLIDMATSMFFSENNNIVQVNAKIKNENIASKKAFERAGYVCKEKLGDYSIYVKRMKDET